MAGLDELIEEIEPVVKELHFALRALEDANLKDNQDDSSPIRWANYMRDRVVPAMEDVREVADRLEGLIPDDLWPLPKYSEMLFIK
jgi:glutamine synthetase